MLGIGLVLALTSVTANTGNASAASASDAANNGSGVNPSLSLDAQALTLPWPIDVPKIKPANCSAGETANNAVTAEKLPYGVVAYLYGSATTGIAANIVAPTNFNPLTATDDELAVLNYAPRPRAKAAQAAWTQHATEYKGQAATQFCQHPKKGAESVPVSRLNPDSLVGTLGNSIYGGYEGINGGYQKVTTTSQFWSANWVSQWVGITSDNTAHSVLVQTGIGIDSGAPYAFWELYCTWSSVCNSAQRVTDYMSKGTSSFIAANQNPASGISYYSVTTNGTVMFNLAYRMPAGSTTGKDALFVIEKGSNGTLGNFGSLRFLAPTTYKQYNAQTGSAIFNSNRYSLYLTSDGAFHNSPCPNSTKLLAYPNNINSDYFDMIWCHSS